MNKRSGHLTHIMLAFAVLASPLLPPGPLAVLAAEQTAPALSKEQAVATARELFHLPEPGWELSSSQLSTGHLWYANNGRPTWYLNFTLLGETYYMGAQVAVDASTGRPIDYSKVNKGGPQAKGNLTRGSAQQEAEKFLAKLAGDEFKRTRLNDNPTFEMFNPYDGAYSFVYDRIENGVKVRNNQLRVSVERDGSISAYQKSWTEGLTFPSATPAVDKSAADQLYASTLNLSLHYQERYTSDKKEMQLLYSTSYRNGGLTKQGLQLVEPMIDAQTGKLINTQGQDVIYTPATPVRPLVPGGPTEGTVRSTPMSQEEAEQAAAKMGLLSDDYQLSGRTYSENGMQTWTLSYDTKSGDQNMASLVIDALSGELISFQNYGQKTGGSTTLSESELIKRATEVTKRLYPARTGAIAEMTPDENRVDNNAPVTFRFLKNGLPTSYGADIMLDSSSGLPLSIYAASTSSLKTDFYSSPEQAISVEKATELFLQNRPLELAYMIPLSQAGTTTGAPKLVYLPVQTPDATGDVEAVKGEWIAPVGISNRPAPLPTDIAGHWAENVLTRLAEKGFLELTEGKAHPNQPLSRGHFIRLLGDVRGFGLSSGKPQTFTDVPPTHKYYGAIEAAVQRGVIVKDTEFHPDAPLSRAETAALLVRTLGFQDIAQNWNLFKLPYQDSADVPNWAVGSVAICNSLSLMTGSSDKFNPNGVLTLAEAATLLDQLNAWLLKSGRSFY